MKTPAHKLKSYEQSFYGGDMMIYKESFDNATIDTTNFIFTNPLIKHTTVETNVDNSYGYIKFDQYFAFGLMCINPLSSNNYNYAKCKINLISAMECWITMFYNMESLYKSNTNILRMRFGYQPSLHKIYLQLASYDGTPIKTLDMAFIATFPATFEIRKEGNNYYGYYNGQLKLSDSYNFSLTNSKVFATAYLNISYPTMVKLEGAFDDFEFGEY